MKSITTLMSSSPKPKSARLIVAGWLTITAGALSLFNGLSVLIADGYLTPEPYLSINQFSVCSIVIVAFGCVGIAGGVCALRGRNLLLALAGAALGALGDGLIGVVCGLSALAILFFSDLDL